MGIFHKKETWYSYQRERAMAIGNTDLAIVRSVPVNREALESYRASLERLAQYRAEVDRSFKALLQEVVARREAFWDQVAAAAGYTGIGAVRSKRLRLRLDWERSQIQVLGKVPPDGAEQVDLASVAEWAAEEAS